MKRALAERAKQSSLPKAPKKTNAVAAHSLQQPQHPPSSSSSSVVVHSPSSPELHPPPMKIPRLHKASSSTSFQHQNSDTSGGGTSGALQSSSSSLPVNHHNMHLTSSVAAGGHGDVGVDSTTTTTSSGGYNQHHHDQQEEATTTHAQAGAVSTKNKRPRNSIENHNHNSSNQEKEEKEEEDDEDEETKASGFYLKHQNRALATELSSLQAAVAELTAEREYRRRTCLEAVQALHSLQATWTSLEAALGQQQHPQLAPSSSTSSSPRELSALAAAEAKAEQQHHDRSSSASRTPASTAGSTPETAVEWTLALHDALQALGNSSGGSTQNQHAAAADSNNDTNHNQNHQPQTQQQPPPPPPPDDPAVVDLGRIAANVSSRANCLQEWIWKLLQSTPEERRRMGNDYHGANFNTDTAMSDADDIQNAAANGPSSKIINNNNDPLFYHWKHSCQRMETQVLELTQSRNQIAQRERKLRRNMYRLAAGMMTQQQVLQQAIHSPDGSTDEHEEFLAATAMAQAAAAAAAAARASATTNHGTTRTTAHDGNNNFKNFSDRGNNSTEGLQATLSSSSSLLPVQEEQGEASSLPPQHDGSSASLSLAMEHVGSSGGVTTAAVAALASSGGEVSSGGKFMSFSALDEMKQQLETARQEVLQGGNTIQELNATLQERELRINQLTAKQLSEEDAQRLILLEATTCKLDVANKTVTELEDKLTRLKTEWAQSAGNDQTLRESMKEMQDKHHKRWYELTSIWSSYVVAPLSTAADDSNSSSKIISNGESTASWQQQRQDESSNGDVTNAVTSTTDAGDGDDLEAAATTADEAAALVAENQERKIMELQHKLLQALENVRQAETARNNLKTALSMNTKLQGKLDDLKHKYAAAVAAVTEQRSSSSSSSANPNTNNSSSRSSNNNTTDVASTPSGGGGGGSSTPRERDSSSASASAATTSSSTHSDRAPHNQERADKLYRDNKKMKKEITAMIASKEAHKAKIERVEKERDGLMDANARLLKQITENDEMNAKSLSTILHLKSMTEHLNAERDNLEQQVKSASQLALASRLASNAKDRVSEEMLKEKNAIHEHLTELETSHAATKDELNRITLEWSLADGKEAAVRSELSNALQRCDELVSQVEEKRQEIRKLVAAFDKAEQEARDTKKKLAESAAAASDNSSGAHRRMSGVAAGTGESGGSTFTVEQLNTQISFLKGRLACPVCHYRDKQCIIMRCRHMHCKQCVDEQISNRSRKCPSCNGKFSEKDVEDVFLD